MKKILFLLFIGILFSCSSNKQKLNPEFSQETPQKFIWKKLGPDTTYVDLLNKFNTSTETYWLGNGRVSSLWADPLDDKHLWAGVGFSGVFETFDKGETWKPITKNIPVLDVNKIIKKDGIFHIATGYRFKNPIRFSAIKHNFYGYGVLTSKDNGKSWSKPSGKFFCKDFSITTNHKVAYAIDTKKVYKSIDSLKSFTIIADFSDKIPEKAELFTIVVNPNDKNQVYVSVRYDSKERDNTLFFSPDGGKSWKNYTKLISNLAPDPLSEFGTFIKDVSLNYDNNFQELWLHASVGYWFIGTNKKKYFKLKSIVLKSNDFTNFQLEFVQDIKNGHHYSPNIYKQDSTLFLLDWYLKIKNPSDRKFINIGEGKTHQDTRAAVRTKKGTLFYGNDAGVFKSDDLGKTWQDAFKNLNANLIVEASYYSDKQKRRIGIGTQDCGYYLNDFNGKPRYPIQTHEGGIYISPHNSNRIYVKDRFTSISHDGGKSFKTIRMNNSKPIKITHSDGLLMEDPIIPTRLYATHYNGLYVSDSLGKSGTWKRISPKKNISGRGASLAISKKDNSILYYANQSVNQPVKNGGYKTLDFKGHLVKSENSGKTWRNVVEEFDELLSDKSIISTVIVDDNNPDRVWFTLRNQLAGKKIFYSKDGGENWKNISYNLANVPTNRVAYDAKNDVLYVANDLGVYYLNNKEWVSFGQELPKVIVTSMFVDNIYNELIISTFGQGVWYKPLKN